MSIFRNFFKQRKISRIKYFKEYGELEIVKKSPKTRDRRQATSHHENNEGRVLLQDGNRHLSRKFLAHVPGS